LGKSSFCFAYQRGEAVRAKDTPWMGEAAFGKISLLFYLMDREKEKNENIKKNKKRDMFCWLSFPLKKKHY